MTRNTIVACLASLMTALLSTFLPTSSRAFFVNNSLSTLGLATSSGHEEITRESLLLFAKQSKEANLQVFAADKLTFKLEEYSGVIDAFAKNFITLGVFATDIPEGRYPLNLKEFYGMPANVDWHNDYRMFHIHSLRNFLAADNKEVESAKSACLGVQSNLLKITKAVLEQWQKNEPKNFISAYFLIGHALHTIQDSFSPAHSIRDVLAKNSDLIQICHYNGRDEASVVDLCFHHPLDPRDNIWLTNDSSKDLDALQKAKDQWLDLGEVVMPLPIANLNDIGGYDINEISLINRESYLTHEARLAKYASVRYLSLVAALIARTEAGEILSDETLAQELDKKFFKGNMGLKSDQKVMPEGVLRCEKLQN